jgi:hypothetical protein
MPRGAVLLAAASATLAALTGCGSDTPARTDAAQAICDTTLAWVTAGASGTAIDDLQTLQRAAEVTRDLHAATEPELAERSGAVARAMTRGDVAATAAAAAELASSCREP